VSSTAEQVNGDSVNSEVVDAENRHSLPAVAERPRRSTRKLKRRLQSDGSTSAADSDTLFGQFVAAELCTITDPAKKLYIKLLIRNIINTALAEH